MDAENVVLDKMNLSLYAGEMVIITGHNGCGKSTVLKIMNGLMKPDKGKIEWQGEEVKKPRELTRNIGIVMQNPGDYFITPTVLDELVLARKSRTPDDVRQVLFDVGLENMSLLTSPKRLSGGQKRRLALASQLLRDPEPSFFTLDEPLVGVDWQGRDEIIQLLAKLRSRFGMVIVSHEPAELIPYANRVVQIARGKAHEVPRSVIDTAIERLKAKAKLEGDHTKLSKD